MSNNLHNDHFTSTRSHQRLVMISWAHLSEEVASLYNFLSVCLWIQFSSDDQIGCSWIGASQDVELQWSVYLRYVCVSAEQCTVGDEGVIVDLRSQPDRVDKYQVSNLQPCILHHAYAHLMQICFSHISQLSQSQPSTAHLGTWMSSVYSSVHEVCSSVQSVPCSVYCTQR